MRGWGTRCGRTIRPAIFPEPPSLPAAAAAPRDPLCTSRHRAKKDAAAAALLAAALLLRLGKPCRSAPLRGRGREAPAGDRCCGHDATGRAGCPRRFYYLVNVRRASAHFAVLSSERGSRRPELSTLVIVFLFLSNFSFLELFPFVFLIPIFI